MAGLTPQHKPLKKERKDYECEACNGWFAASEITATEIVVTGTTVERYTQIYCRRCAEELEQELEAERGEYLADQQAAEQEVLAKEGAQL